MDPRRTVTSTTLLNGLADRRNDQVWSSFDVRYRPIVIGFVRGLGLSEEDAAEVAQQTLAEFSRDYLAGRYERGKGRLGSWLMGIAHHRAMDVMRAKAKRRDWRGESAFVEKAGPAKMTQTWGAAQQQVIYEEAMKKLKETSKLEEKTVRAFELTAVRHMPAEQAGKECGMTAAEVYVAKNRVIKRLREIVREITSAYDEDK